MSVTVFSKPDCPQCIATQRSLAKAGIDFTVEDLLKNPDILEALKREGFTQAPVVDVDGEKWAGYQPGKIKALAAAMEGKQTPTQQATTPKAETPAPLQVKGLTR